MSKINGLFKADDVVKQQPVKKPSIKKQLADAEKEVKSVSKQSSPKSKKNDEHEL